MLSRRWVRTVRLGRSGVGGVGVSGCSRRPATPAVPAPGRCGAVRPGRAHGGGAGGSGARADLGRFAGEGLVQGLPGLFGWFWELSYDLLLAWSLVLVALALLARGCNRLLAEEVAAGGLAVGVALVAGWGPGPTGRTASRRSRRRWAAGVAGGAAGGGHRGGRHGLAVPGPAVAVGGPVGGRGRGVAGVALGTSLPIGMVAAFAVGVGSAAVVHLLFGSPAGGSPWTRSPAPWRSWGGCLWARPGPLERRGWPSSPPKGPVGARCWSSSMAGTPGMVSCSPLPGRRCGTAATPLTWPLAAGPRSSTRPLSPCWPSGPGRGAPGGGGRDGLGARRVAGDRDHRPP
jgi:hypothetical protein